MAKALERSELNKAWAPTPSLFDLPGSAWREFRLAFAPTDALLDAERERAKVADASA